MDIKFIPYSKFASDLLSLPVPASSVVPEWYRNMPRYTNNDTKAGLHLNNAVASNTTVKSCSPFLDALTAGYIWLSPVDIEIRNVDGHYSFRWRTEGDFVTPHSNEQVPGLPILFTGNDFVLKWSFDYIINTPPGWSTFFTHPLNRHDLPFQTFSGIVDTDVYDHPVQFPFQTKKIDDFIILEKGTPLCQFFPIKREMWKSSTENWDGTKERQSNFNFHSKIVQAYKSKYWHKKRWT